MPTENVECIEVRLELRIAAELLQAFPADVMQTHALFPLRRVSRGLLFAAAGSPAPAEVQTLSDRLGLPLFFLHCDPDAVQELSRRLRRLRPPTNHGGSGRKASAGAWESWLQTLTADYGLNDLLDVPVTLQIPVPVAQAIPAAFCRFSRVLPLGICDTEILIASEKFLDRPLRNEIQHRTGRTVARIPVGPQGLLEAIEAAFQAQPEGPPAPPPQSPPESRTPKEQRRLGEVLISEGLLTPAQLDLCLEEQRRTRTRLGELLIKRGYISEEATYRALAGKAGCEYRPFDVSEIDLSLSHLISRRFAEQHLVLPFKADRERGELTVVLTDPFDLGVQDILQGIAAQSGYQVSTVMASPFQIHRGIAHTYETRDIVTADVDVETVLEAVEDSANEDLIDSADLSHIKQVANRLLYSGVVEGASDIHIENLEHRVQVRFRIDGVLEERTTPLTRRNISSVISVLKLDSKLDIAERRRSQDGVFKKRIGRDRVIDFRINIHQSQFGEDAVIRILDRHANLLPLEGLGFSSHSLKAYRRLIENPQGLVLLSGPTGSGKTTTLYSTLNYLNNQSKKIVTAEDPIEYTLKGITQCQVDERIGNTFEEFAKRLLRKDPDIILIGEIRDAKTAKACVNAAMTGHLVFSTLHTNDTIGAIGRLRSLGVPEASIAGSLLAVISQRLARRTCSHCREEYKPDEELLHDFFNGNQPEGWPFLRGRGCSECRSKGYRGRVGLYEYWELHPETQKVIADQAGEAAIRESALSHGMEPLLNDALTKVRAGVTTVEELKRVVAIDQIRRYTAD